MSYCGLQRKLLYVVLKGLSREKYEKVAVLRKTRPNGKRDGEKADSGARRSIVVLRQMPFGTQVGVAPLAEHLIHADGDGVGQIQ